MLQHSHSQLGQEALAARHLRSRRGGFFVELGAADGLLDSNTYALETELGWGGLCIEPDPDLYARLLVNRRCLRDPRCAVPPRYADRRLFEFAQDGTYGGVIGLSDGHVGRAGRRILVPGAPLVEILGSHGVPPLIDYLSVDIEGAELAVLDDPALWRRYRILCLTVEHNGHLSHAAARRRDRLREFLGDKGYAVLPLGWDDLYYHCILLLPERAQLIGRTVKLEETGGPLHVGFWTDPADRVGWAIELQQGLRCVVEICYAAAQAADGARYRLRIANQQSRGAAVATDDADLLEGVVRSTGSWCDYSDWLPVGELDVPAGASLLEVLGLAMPNRLLMNLRALRLIPLGPAGPDHPVLPRPTGS